MTGHILKLCHQQGFHQSREPPSACADSRINQRDQLTSRKQMSNLSPSSLAQSCLTSTRVAHLWISCLSSPQPFGQGVTKFPRTSAPKQELCYRRPAARHWDAPDETGRHSNASRSWTKAPAQEQRWCRKPVYPRPTLWAFQTSECVNRTKT